MWEHYGNVILMNGRELLHSIFIHIRRHIIAHKGASVEEMLMRKSKLTLVAAALSGGLLALAPMSGAFAAPVAPIGKAANTIDSGSTVHYRYYHHRHHRHCMVIATAAGGKGARQRGRWKLIVDGGLRRGDCDSAMSTNCH
jgi:hypothetical protein